MFSPQPETWRHEAKVAIATYAHFLFYLVVLFLVLFLYPVTSGATKKKERDLCECAHNKQAARRITLQPRKTPCVRIIYQVSDMRTRSIVTITRGDRLICESKMPGTNGQETDTRVGGSQQKRARRARR